MAVEWSNVFTVLGVIFLLLFAIPVHINDTRPDDEETKFQNFIMAYNKTYEASEYRVKLDSFKKVLRTVRELNANRSVEQSALYGLTQFADLSTEEFRQTYLQENLHIHHKCTNEHQLNSSDEDSSMERIISKRAAKDLPLKVDWREKGIIGEIRNQLLCGACWAFSTIETVESMTALKTGQLPNLSVQEVIDCAENGNMGCRGGDPCSLLEWLVANKIGIVPEKKYPLNWATNACLMKGKTEGVKVTDYICANVIGQEDELLSTLANHGPVSVAVNALSWQFYTGGVIQYHCDGNPLSLNHVVQLVGYDRTSSIPYYIGRNSWGTAFGDNGYVYIAIGKNMCGLGTEVSSLNVDPPNTTV